MKLRMALGGPGEVATKRLEDEEGLVEFVAPLDGAVEGEVVGGAAGGDHPVENVVAEWIDRGLVAGLNAQ